MFHTNHMHLALHKRFIKKYGKTVPTSVEDLQKKIKEVIKEPDLKYLNQGNENTCVLYAVVYALEKCVLWNNGVSSGIHSLHTSFGTHRNFLFSRSPELLGNEWRNRTKEANVRKKT